MDHNTVRCKMTRCAWARVTGEEEPFCAKCTLVETKSVFEPVKLLTHPTGTSLGSQRTMVFRRTPPLQGSCRASPTPSRIKTPSPTAFVSFKQRPQPKPRTSVPPVIQPRPQARVFKPVVVTPVRTPAPTPPHVPIRNAPLRATAPVRTPTPGFIPVPPQSPPPVQLQNRFSPLEMAVEEVMVGDAMDNVVTRLRDNTANPTQRIISTNEQLRGPPVLLQATGTTLEANEDSLNMRAKQRLMPRPVPRFKEMSATVLVNCRENRDYDKLPVFKPELVCYDITRRKVKWYKPETWTAGLSERLFKHDEILVDKMMLHLLSVEAAFLPRTTGLLVTLKNKAKRILAEYDCRALTPELYEQLVVGTAAAAWTVPSFENALMKKLQQPEVSKRAANVIK